MAVAQKKQSADQPGNGQPKGPIADFSKGEELSAYRTMLSIRRFEEKAGQLYGMGLIGGFCHLYIGQEAVVVGIQAALQKDIFHPSLIQPTVPGFELRLHRHREPHLRGRYNFSPEESGRGYADDHVVASIHDHIFANHALVAAKTLPPAFVAQHRDRMPAWRQIILR